MGFFGAIGSAISSVCSAVSSGMGSLFSGGGMSIGMSVIADTFSKIMPTIGLDIKPFIECVGKIITAVAEFFGLTAKEENLEEFGEKALQADKKPDDFESTEEYIKYIREEIELDREKFDKKSPEEKQANAILASSIILEGIKEKSGMDIEPTTLVDIVKMGIKPEDASKILVDLKNVDVSNAKDMTDVLKGDYTGKDIDKILDVLSENFDKMGADFDDLAGKLGE